MVAVGGNPDLRFRQLGGAGRVADDEPEREFTGDGLSDAAPHVAGGSGVMAYLVTKRSLSEVRRACWSSLEGDTPRSVASRVSRRRPAAGVARAPPRSRARRAATACGCARPARRGSVWPIGRHRAVRAGRGLGCLDLDVVDDVEADLVEQPDPRRDRQVELDARLVDGVAPVKSAQIEVGPFKTSVTGSEPSIGEQTIASGWLPRNTRSPPGRRRRCASVIQVAGSHQIAAPYSLIAKSNEPSGWGTFSALPCTHSMSSSPWNRSAGAPSPVGPRSCRWRTPTRRDAASTPTRSPSHSRVRSPVARPCRRRAGAAPSRELPTSPSARPAPTHVRREPPSRRPSNPSSDGSRRRVRT